MASDTVSEILVIVTVVRVLLLAPWPVSLQQAATDVEIED